ncbi:TetR/AcrR family transcriptional regulator [Leucobacter soli]|uniref:HTH tetR-type domain-containing protein n=1 Tax=Leucobacter soli TaxID=2812850 RepID=A0A916JZ57_9MICO|nr:TetR/AcrR family transcriptional regulator [Leucobacter soli]CAG7612006.1 hypothetical protein LEUCIP111803_01514 [Leucobacter soli]
MNNSAAKSTRKAPSKPRSKSAPAHARGEGRDAILKAAYELMLQDRVSSVSHRSVAARAGVAVGLIRYHFSTRTTLLLACITHLMEERHEVALEALSRCRPGLDPIETGRLAVTAYTGPDISDSGLTSTLAALLDTAREDRVLSEFLIAERPTVEGDLMAVLEACGWGEADPTLVLHVIDGALVAGIVDKQPGLLDVAARSCAAVLSLSKPH